MSNAYQKSLQAAERQYHDPFGLVLVSLFVSDAQPQFASLQALRTPTHSQRSETSSLTCVPLVTRSIAFSPVSRRSQWLQVCSRKDTMLDLVSNYQEYEASSPSRSRSSLLTTPLSLSLQSKLFLSHVGFE